MKHTLELSGDGVRLVPLAVEHAAAAASLVDADLWAGMPVPLPVGEEGMTAYIEGFLAQPGRLPFAVLDAATGAIIGVTTYYDVDLAVRRLEIGSTFYGREWQGGRTNPATKLLLLEHAFEQMGMQRAALRADVRNVRSIAAIRKLGATYEGTLRSHRIASDGVRSDTVYFSILADEWPAVKDSLLTRIARLDGDRA